MAGEIRKLLGKNVIIHNGLSVGVAWTSVCVSHEPLEPSPEDEEEEEEKEKEEAKAGAADPPQQAPSSPSFAKTDAGNGPGSPGSVGTAAATVVTGRGGGGAGKTDRPASPREGENPEHAEKHPGRKRNNHRRRRDGSREESRKKKKTDRGRKKGGGGDRDTGESGGSGSGGERAGREGQRQRQRRNRRRHKSLGACSPRKSTPKRGRRRVWGRGKASATDVSSGEEVRLFFPWLFARRRRFCVPFPFGGGKFFRPFLHWFTRLSETCTERNFSVSRNGHAQGRDIN